MHSFFVTNLPFYFITIRIAVLPHGFLPGDVAKEERIYIREGRWFIDLAWRLLAVISTLHFRSPILNFKQKSSVWTHYPELS